MAIAAFDGAGPDAERVLGIELSGNTRAGDRVVGDEAAVVGD